MARKPKLSIVTDSDSKKPTKLSIVEQFLRQPDGATIADIMSATGWQQHSVRGVISGTLRKKGIEVTSSMINGERPYSARFL